jgi:hypothetical protein
MDLALIPKAAPQAIHTTLGDTAVILNLDDSNTSRSTPPAARSGGCAMAPMA